MYKFVKVDVYKTFSVRIDVEQLLRDREAALNVEGKNVDSPVPTKNPEVDDGKRKRRPNKRKLELNDIGSTPRPKKAKISVASKALVSLKLEPERFPCCLCVSESTEELLCVMDPPRSLLKPLGDADGVLRAHKSCADVIPETWVDEVPITDNSSERVIFGVDGIVKDRWNLVCSFTSLGPTNFVTKCSSQKCSVCTKIRHKDHGAPIQCTKGKCSKAFHVPCARDGINNGIVYSQVREVEKEVVLMAPVISKAIHSPDSIAGQAPINNMNTIMPDSGSASTELLESESSAAIRTPIVLKVVRKQEVEVLCAQHNPVSFPIQCLIMLC